MGEIILVTGGARSGKSVFAERYVKKQGNKLGYIATAQIYDEEMRRRVDLHKLRRGAEWTTVEAPVAAEAAIAALSKTTDCILFDCLTLYVSNMLCGPSLPVDTKARCEYVKIHILRLIEQARQNAVPVVFVTNEVGMGIVPDNALAREYRDLAGLTNQMIAAAATKVYLVISGIAVDVKQIAVNLEE